MISKSLCILCFLFYNIFQDVIDRYQTDSIREQKMQPLFVYRIRDPIIQKNQNCGSLTWCVYCMILEVAMPRYGYEYRHRYGIGIRVCTFGDLVDGYG